MTLILPWNESLHQIRNGTVWSFLRGRPELWTGGHNIFVYHHAKEAGAPLVCDFAVEGTCTFDAAGEVFATVTPTGEAVVAVYRGPYDRLHEAYDAIDTWMTARARGSAGHSWEIYADPTPNPADIVTTVLHLLS